VGFERLKNFVPNINRDEKLSLIEEVCFAIYLTLLQPDMGKNKALKIIYTSLQRIQY
jgi:hypothetical protein